jgi:RNA polymerase sigma factor (sigma-70 family)
MAKDWYKRKKSVSLDQAIEAGHEPMSHVAGPETDASHAEILRAMSELEEHDRIVLHLRFTEGLPPQDIASLLQETPNVISVRITRATKKLQTILGI